MMPTQPREKELEAMTPSELFYRATGLFGPSDSVSWVFHTHAPNNRSSDIDYALGGIYHTSGVIRLVHGRQVYDPVGGIASDPDDDFDFITLQVPWRVRQAIQRTKGAVAGGASIDNVIDEVVASSISRLSGAFKEVHSEFKVTLGYVFPNPSYFKQVTVPLRHASVLVSIVSPKYVIEETVISAAALNLEVLVSPGTLAAEVGLVSNVILTSEGVTSHPACYSEASGPLQHTLDAYVQLYVLPNLKRLEQSPRR